MLGEGKRIPLTAPLIVNNRPLVNPGRICPGKYLALRTAYLVVVRVLSLFEIGPVLDEDGNPRMPKPEFDSATIRYVFLESSIHTAADADRPVTLHQGS